MWIADVFGRERAEQIELDDIPQLFHRSRQMDILERPDNHIILGAKGSGKSTALRALTYRAWCQRTPGQKPLFVGIYVPMGFDAVNRFRVAFEEGCSTALFEHFFCCSVLYRLLTQFNGVLPARFPVAKLLAPHWGETVPTVRASLGDTADTALADLSTVLKAVHADPKGDIGQVGLRLRPFSIQSLNEFAERFALLATDCEATLPPRLALLVDSFDYYGPLGSTLAPLMQSDAGVPLVVKLAARTLNIREVFGIAPTRMLELGRDCDIVSLDRETDDQEHRELVADAICRRARTFGPESARQLADYDILQILFAGAEGDDEDITSFASFCRLSSGNVLTVLLLIDKAAELQRTEAVTRPDALTPLSRESRLKAINELSTIFWDYEIGVRVPSQKMEARVFCESALALAKESAPLDSGCPRFTLKTLASDRSLIVNMLATRVLTATDESVNRRAQSAFEVSAPLIFELNRMLLPRHNRLPRSTIDVELEYVKFSTIYKKALKGARPHLSPQTTRAQRELFRADFRVFVSMPFDPKKKGRTSIIRKSINRIYREMTGHDGREGLSYVDIHYLPHVGPFRSEIPGFIRDATYVIADISDISESPDKAPGVFYEVGVAIGERKPLALFHNSRRRPSGGGGFRVELLPAVLRGESVLVWDDSAQNFFEEFKRVHEKLIAYNGVWSPPAEARPVRAGSPYAYLSFEARNAIAKDWFTSLVRKLYPELRVEVSRSWMPDDLAVLVDTIQGAELCIIDCTQRINEQALELGLAATTGTKRVLEVWDATLERNVNPVAMFPGQKWAWADLAVDEERQAIRVLRDIGRATMLGSRRP